MCVQCVLYSACMQSVSRRVPIILVPFTGHAETNRDNTNGDTMAMQKTTDRRRFGQRRLGHHDDSRGTP